jgi:hypothetical protein
MADGAHGLHRLVEIHRTHADELIGVRVHPAGHFLVADERALGAVPCGQQPHPDPARLHRGERELQGYFDDAAASHPTAERVEHGLLDEALRRVLHPYVDSQWGVTHIPSLP